MVVKTTQKDNILQLKNCQAEQIKKVIQLLSDTQTALIEAINLFLDNQIAINDITEALSQYKHIFLPNYVGERCCMCDNPAIRNLDIEYIIDDCYCNNCFGEKLEDMKEDYISRDLEHYPVTMVNDCVDMRDCYSNKVKEELPF